MSNTIEVIPGFMTLQTRPIPVNGGLWMQLNSGVHIKYSKKAITINEVNNALKDLFK